MSRLNDTKNIDIFLQKLGKYWKYNRELRFGEVIAILDSKSNSGIFNSDYNILEIYLDKLILESCYPELREEIIQVYKNEIDGLDEEMQSDLINYVLESYIEGEALIASTAMRIRVSGYLEGYLSVKY